MMLLTFMSTYKDKHHADVNDFKATFYYNNQMDSWWGELRVPGTGSGTVG